MSEKIKTLKIIHLALCTGITLSYLLIGEFSLDALQNTVVDASSLAFLTVPIGAFVLSTVVFKMLLRKIDSKSDMSEKINAYQTTSLLRWAILQGAAFVILFVKPEFFVLGVLILIYMILLRPTRQRISNDLEIPESAL